MRIETVWGKRRAVALGALGLALHGCSGLNHDCVERRDCPAPNLAIDAGGDEWWNVGSAGQDEGGAADLGLAGAPGESRLADASDAGDGYGGAAAEEPLDAPRLLRLDPPDGARGVANDARMVLVFDRAMDRSATESAYHSADLPAAELTFAWNEAQTTLTLTPRAPLRYASADSDPNVDAPAMLYRYGFDESARDEQGRALPALELSFSTLRTRSLELAADAMRTGNWTDGTAEGIHNCLRQPKAPYLPTVCVGDDTSNLRYTGFLSFDLGVLPADIAQFSSATLTASGASYGSASQLGESQLEQVAFGDLGPAALGAKSFALLGSFYGASDPIGGVPFVLNADVTRAVADDYAQQALRGSLSQYRLGFTKVLANGRWDDIELPTASIRLKVSVLVP
jgi:hypothetical protein